MWSYLGKLGTEIRLFNSAFYRMSCYQASLPVSILKELLYCPLAHQELMAVTWKVYCVPHSRLGTLQKRSEVLQLELAPLPDTANTW